MKKIINSILTGFVFWAHRYCKLKMYCALKAQHTCVRMKTNTLSEHLI